MNTSAERLKSLYDQPSTYKIHVQGDVGNLRPGDIESMWYEVIDGSNTPPTIVFTGVLANQTELHSILMILFSRNFVLLSVSRLD
jgi:hypothetical protein